VNASELDYDPKQNWDVAMSPESTPVPYLDGVFHKLQGLPFFLTHTHIMEYKRISTNINQSPIMKHEPQFHHSS